MIKKEVIDLNPEDSMAIVEKIKNDRDNASGFINIVKNLTGKKYIEENKFVLFNIVLKEKNFFTLTSERTSIGYILPDNTVYDFIANRLYDIYELHNYQNKEKNGRFALINNIIFKNSKKKISLTKNNLDQITNLFDKYIKKYKKGEKHIRDYDRGSENEECIPEFSRRLSLFN